jgi:magnesium-transporting ATPase (P-type)
VKFDELENSIDGLEIAVMRVSITDTVREDVMDAIKLFQENNIQIKILSEDCSCNSEAVKRNRVGYK